MRIDIITLFPAMFTGPLTESIIKRAIDNKLLDIRFHDLREYGKGKYRQIDDTPYGGGAGMVMMAEPLVDVIEKISGVAGGLKRARRVKGIKGTPFIIYLSPRGETLNQQKVELLASDHEWLILVCGHYEGIDQRVIDGWIDEEISIGEYVLTGGELPAMVLIDAIARHIPGVLGKDESAHEESFSASLDRKKEYPQYTKPDTFRDMKVPDVLLSGNHGEIEKWRRQHVV